MSSRGGDALNAVVVANGALPALIPFGGLLRGADLVVAADGGARALLMEGLPLHAVLGDLDSLPADMVAQWRATGGDTLTFPAEKDQTDLELALHYLLDRGAQRIVILGALGGRVDHEMANLLLLAAPSLQGCDVAVLDRHVRVVAVRDSIELHGRPGDLLSLLPVTASAEGIVTQGLKYALNGETLGLGSPRGVSNIFVAERATVQVSAGMLLAIHTWSYERTLTW